MMRRMSTAAQSAGYALLVLCMVGCGEPDEPTSPADVAVSSTYLAAAVRDVLGADAAVDCLAGPGNCPGHFDAAPDQVVRLARTKLLLRFAFQSRLDAKLQAAVDEGLTIAEVRTTAGLGLPETYLTACRQVGDALVDAGMLTQSAADARLAEIGRRVTETWADAKAAVASPPATDRRAIVAVHQADVVRGLGIEIVATFGGADDPGELRRVAEAVGEEQGLLVIGNVPQGRGMADKLADVVGGRVVMFENFPPNAARCDNYDGMLAVNVSRLRVAWEQP